MVLDRYFPASMSSLRNTTSFFVNRGGNCDPDGRQEVEEHAAENRCDEAGRDSQPRLPIAASRTRLSKASTFGSPLPTY